MAGAATLGLPLAEYLARLRDEGLSSLPTAAEVLDDEVRRVICPDKVTTDQWLEVHDTAHRLGPRSNNTIMFGHVDGPVSWARHLLRVREQQRLAAASRSSSRRSCTWRRRCTSRACSPRPDVREFLLMHAEAGAPSMDHEHPGLVGQGRAGRRCGGAAGGVNDLGGTLMNESISRAAGAEFGQEMPPERMEEMIRDAGRVPRQRTTL